MGVNPRAVVEVLSDGTEAYDRGQKLDHYRHIPSLPSLAAVVLVAHRAPTIEIWERGSDSARRRREFGPGQAAEMQASPARPLVDEVYQGSEP